MIRSRAIQLGASMLLTLVLSSSARAPSDSEGDAQKYGEELQRDSDSPEDLVNLRDALYGNRSDENARGVSEAISRCPKDSRVVGRAAGASREPGSLVGARQLLQKVDEEAEHIGRLPHQSAETHRPAAQARSLATFSAIVTDSGRVPRSSSSRSACVNSRPAPNAA